MRLRPTVALSITRSDSESKALVALNSSRKEIQWPITEILALVSGNFICSFNPVPRVCNSAAHNLAKLALSSSYLAGRLATGCSLFSVILLLSVF